MIGQISSFKDTSWGTIEQLEGEDINCLVITGTIVPDETVEDIYTDIRNLGKIFKVEDKAEELIQKRPLLPPSPVEVKSECERKSPYAGGFRGPFKILCL